MTQAASVACVSLETLITGLVKLMLGSTLIDKDWKFIAGDVGGKKQCFTKSGAWKDGAQAPDFDDSGWESVNLPHDYIIDGVPTCAKNRGEDLSDIPAMQTMDSMLTANGSLERYVAWYRKHFFVERSSENNRIFIRFDGVMRNSVYYINGFYLDTHFSGYTPAQFDITDFLNFGGDNVISVKVDPRIPEGWWYEGGGIYRHVWLIETPQVYALEEDIFVHCDVCPPNRSATVHIETELHNLSERTCNCEICYKIISPDKRIVAEKSVGVLLQTGKSDVFTATVNLEDVSLWSDVTPSLYTLEAHLPDGLCHSVSFGIRQAYFDTEKGFILNGKPTKMRGVCLHQDHAGVGCAIFDGLDEYRLSKMKEMGCNAVRTSHNPPTPEFLHTCDRLGILVMDETRLFSSSPEDIRTLKSMVRRDRNHPSVVIYSIGNEEIHTQFKPCAEKIAKTMRREIYLLDNTRPVTEALLYWDFENRCVMRDVSKSDGIVAGLDVVGLNYAPEIWDDMHEHYGDKPFIVTEAHTFPTTRGCLYSEPDRGTVGIFTKDAHEHFAGEMYWQEAAKRDFVSGLFFWTGIDYRGEPTPYQWPSVSSQFGITDSCCFEKDCYYYYRAWWRDEPIIHLVGDANTDDDNKHVLCFTNCNEVELWVNGVCTESVKVPKNGHIEFKDFVYKRGEIKAIGYADGVAVCEDVLTAAESPEKIVMTLDGSYISKDDRRYSIVNVHTLDKNGVFVSFADNEIAINVTGGKIIGVGNGDPALHTAAKSNRIRLFGGRAQIIIESEEESATLEIKAYGVCGSSVIV